MSGVARKAREIQLFLGVDAYLHVLSLITFYIEASGTNGSGDTHQPLDIPHLDQLKIVFFEIKSQLFRKKINKYKTHP